MTTRITRAHVDRIRSLAVDGLITPRRVLADARDPESPLHELYDWDTQRAAERHWLERTREIIRSVQVVVTTELRTYKLPQYIEAADKNGAEQGYVSVDTLRQDPAMSRRALLQEFERAAAVLRRARTIACGLGYEAEIDELIERVTGLRVILSDGGGDGDAISQGEQPPAP